MNCKHVCLIAGALIAAGAPGGPALPQTAINGVVMQALPASDAETGAAQTRPIRIHVLSASDHDIFGRAFAAAARSDWVDALALGNQGQDTAARQLLQWRYALDKNSGAPFAAIDDVLKMAVGWPSRNSLYARGEQAMPPDMTPAQIIAWFGSRTPVSGIGDIRLGEALLATGQPARGTALIQTGWSEGSFDDVTEAGILARDAATITPESDKARLDSLIWRSEYSAARRQLARVDARTAAIAQARMALSAGLAHAQPFLAKLGGATSPALLFDWSRALRHEHKDAEAHVMLLRVAAATLARDHPARWWTEINVQARDALTTGQPRLALSLVDHAELAPGDQYSEQQFLGGFIALRFLKDPATATLYFQRLGAGVARPISKSRADYWLGRAYEASGDAASALTHYRLAGTHSDTFYGQLALARIDPAPVLHLTDTGTELNRAEIESDALMPHIKVLADLGLEADLRLFADREAEAYPAPRHLRQFLQSLSDWGYREIAVRLAKQAGYVGTPMLSFSHPLITLPPFHAPGQPPEPALVLGLIRQETEFDAYAISSAGARGLMQMMPASAKIAAKTGGLPYRPNDLLSDQDYNMQLGMIEFAGHLATWNGSLVLAAASYNAGPGNVRKWIATYGDPRQPGIDPLDWIEQIPFSETRNYVQRVLENMEVYRARLAGKDVPLPILADLYAPATPPTALLGTPSLRPRTY